MAKALTDLAIRNLKPKAKRREVPDGKVPGLYYVIQPTGSTSWIVRFRHLGKPAKLTIGGGAIPLAEARDLAREALVKIAKGENPAAQKIEATKAAKAAQQRESDLIEKVVETFIDRYAKKHTKEKSWREAERILKREIAASWKGKALGEITRADVHDRLDAIVDRGSPIMAIRTFRAFGRLCSWAVERGIIAASPCDNVRAPASEQSRDRVLTDNELRAFWRACDQIGKPFGPLAKILLLTGQRREEVGAMTWAELDLPARKWTIPKERAKNGVAHEVALSDAALALLATTDKIERPREKGALALPAFVFTTTGRTPVSGYSKAKEQLDAAMNAILKAEAGDEFKEPARWTFHDLRRTAASGMAGLGIAPHVVEAVLNHKSGTIKGVAAVYNRYSYADEKRAALDAWARRLDMIVSGKPAGNVVELAGARK
ncbi:site-specific integrase [Rhodoblastus sp.]|uniref:tyrosine-type recombinase/integrase n=1 Tax=Rhodoblastus sp. TaxID=1962975 RepID=UPI002622D091|nr:site-specific integrase [Rhodoblastus sp.]